MKRRLLALLAVGALAVTATTVKADRCLPYAPGFAYRPAYGGYGHGYSRNYHDRDYRAPRQAGYRDPYHHRQAYRRPDDGYGRAGYGAYGRAPYGAYGRVPYGHGSHRHGVSGGRVNLGYRGNGIQLRLGF